MIFLCSQILWVSKADTEEIACLCSMTSEPLPGKARTAGNDSKAMGRNHLEPLRIEGWVQLGMSTAWPAHDLLCSLLFLQHGAGFPEEASQEQVCQESQAEAGIPFLPSFGSQAASLLLYPIGYDPLRPAKIEGTGHYTLPLGGVARSHCRRACELEAL